LRLFSFGGYGPALAALALVVFGAIECPPPHIHGISHIWGSQSNHLTLCDLLTPFFGFFVSMLYFGDFFLFSTGYFWVGGWHIHIYNKSLENCFLEKKSLPKAGWINPADFSPNATEKLRKST